MSEVLQYLNSKGIQYKIKGKDAFIVCPHCGKNSLSIQIESGVLKCWNCVNLNLSDSPFLKGHISSLKKTWGDILNVGTLQTEEDTTEEKDFTDMAERYHYDLKQDRYKHVLKYLFKRGFTEETIDFFKFGATSRYNQDWVSIPSYENGKARLLKFRKVPPYSEECHIEDKYIREAGCKSILFNQDALKEHDEIIITEGELCAASLIQNGFRNVVGITVGAGTLAPEWYDLLVNKTKIYLAFDNDQAGQKSARDTWAARLGVGRIYNIKFTDCKDVDEFFLTHTKDEFIELKNKAERFKIDGIYSIKEVLLEMHKKSNEKGELVFPTPWDSINRYLNGGFKKTHLCTLGAGPGIGKTTLSLQIAHHFAKVYNIPSFVMCLEMREIDLVIKLLQLEYDLTQDEISYDDALYYMKEGIDLPIYFGYKSFLTPDLYYNTVKEVHNRFGCEFFVFDNLQILCRTEENNEIGKVSKLFKEIPMSLDAMMLMISQPRKLNRENSITYDDLRGNSAIAADADEIILLTRKRKEQVEGYDAFDPKTKVIVEKSRFGSGGISYLNYIGAKARFEEFERDGHNKH